MSTMMNAPVTEMTGRANALELTESEIREFRVALAAALSSWGTFESEEFLATLPIYAQRLPERLRRFLLEFKYDPCRQGYCIVSGLPVDDRRLGPTPAHWQLKTNNDTCKEAAMATCLYSALLGDVFGWLTQQDGRMVHDVLPIRELESEQIGSGSLEELTWHTEDAFHELRGDYLLLFCLRNPDRIPTTIARPDYRKLSTGDIESLFQPQFTIRPDNSHKPAFGSDRQRSPYLERAYAAMQDRESRPQKLAVLFGSKADPYLRIDPYFMDEPDSEDARLALRALVDVIDESIVEVPLQPGQCLILDNYLVVHGRRAFKARYDGNDRWLKRVAVMRDIRKCRHVLETRDARIIY
jgi:Fe(II)/alpha-ketoglutarate-dependent arginine beta-hydroxylase